MASTSLSAKMPMQSSPPTCHFWVSQFGLHEWFRNLDRLPLLVASITSPFAMDMK